jgi:hypothetical protein
MTNPADKKVSRRGTKHAAGLRPVRIWVPDTRSPGFAEECRRQSMIVAAAEAGDRNLNLLIETALADIDRTN